MNGWEFAKYFVDKAYDHYFITFFFLLAVMPWNTVKLVHGGKEKHE